VRGDTAPQVQGFGAIGSFGEGVESFRTPLPLFLGFSRGFPLRKNDGAASLPI